MTPANDNALASFHNSLRILQNVEMSDFLNAAIGDYAAWRSFSNDPYRFFIRANDTTVNRLWALIQQNQPEKLRAA